MDYKGDYITLMVVFFMVFNSVIFYTQIVSSIIPSQDKPYIQDIESKILSQAEIISNARPYILNRYDCSQFSRDLSLALRKQGMNAYCRFGYYYEEGRRTPLFHTWVEVKNSNELIEVEATGGYIIDKEDYKKHYFALAKGVCA